MNKRYLEKLQPIKRDIRNANKLSSSNTFMTNSNDTTKEDIDIGKKSQTRSNFYNEKIQINCESDKSKDEESLEDGVLEYILVKKCSLLKKLQIIKKMILYPP